ncbi:uncharacterized protein LOC117176356 [Belonocnema kinseyi]|uniref:uncharacterized protein LOC117176356 n=1 Tax=Belonocnema kinseyi TaxID=2817044 RepID=UPI00143D2964|nr:uncharacterized protein LOC117176356 [Belonocnema kinseyi]
MVYANKPATIDELRTNIERKIAAFDAPIQRLMSLRATRREYFKPNALNFVMHVALVFLPFALLAAGVKKERGIREHQYRTGQVAYKDRYNKFA